ncbi:MAG: hypothetical protein M9894_30585 [Planctomycetes bacterium]|nr:hypothetical protein [Planctomycetota bacterium]
MGVELSRLEVLVLARGHELRTPAGAALALVGLLLVSILTPRAGRAARAWWIVGAVQAMALAAASHELFGSPERWVAEHGELSPCGNQRLGVPLAIVWTVVLPLGLIQAGLWCVFAGAAWRAPAGSRAAEPRRALVVAALPCALWATVVHLDGRPLPTTALTVTGCGFLVGAALVVRLRA